MPKKLKVKLNDRLDLIYFYHAYLRARTKKKQNIELLKFDIDLETNLIGLVKRIKNGTYHLGKYREFMVYEPKLRVIKSLPFQDRIVHQWYIGEFIKPYIVPRFIKDSYACLEGRGTHQAVLNLQKYMRIMKRQYNDYYILKCDIRKFFYSINLDVLFDIMSSFIVDEKLLAFTKQLIYENVESKIGIPIGNYTSQYFANIYLNELDQFVKQEKRVKYYVRYMDDFILLVPTREEAKILFNEIKEFVKNRLYLEFNNKSRYFPNKMGVDFCGYRIFETHCLLRKRSAVGMKKKVKRWNQAYMEERLDIANVQQCWNSWLGHSNHASTFHLQERIFSSISFSHLLQRFPNSSIDDNI